MLETDDLPSANQREGIFRDHHFTHRWDADRILGSLLSRTLNLKRSVAWDVYLAYPPGHIWDVELPSAPEFWMHQLDGDDPALFLDPLRLKSAVQAMTEEST